MTDRGRLYAAQLSLRFPLTILAEPSDIPPSIIHHFYKEGQPRSAQQVQLVLAELAALSLTSSRILAGVSFLPL